MLSIEKEEVVLKDALSDLSDAIEKEIMMDIMMNKDDEEDEGDDFDEDDDDISEGHAKIIEQFVEDIKSGKITAEHLKKDPFFSIAPHISHLGRIGYRNRHTISNIFPSILSRG